MLAVGRRKLTTPAFRLNKDRRGNFEVTWTDPATGKTRRRACHTRDRAKALLVQPRIEAEVLHPAPATSYTIGELIDAYIEDRTQLEHSRTFAHNFTHIRAFFGSYLPPQLNDAAFRGYRKQRTQQTVANAGALASKSKPKFVADSTAVRELNALRGAIGWGKRNHWKGLENVIVHTPNSTPNVRRRYLTRVEAERLLKACIELHTALFVRLSLATGARMSAVLGLMWDDVSFPRTAKGIVPSDEVDLVAINIRDEPTTYWTNAKTGEVHCLGGYDFDLNLAAPMSFDLGQGRGNKRRGLGLVSPTNVKLYDALVCAYKRRKSPYVIEYRGKKVNKVDLTDAYRRAGITGATQHTLKHTCCSWLVQAGQSYESIAKLVGTSAKTIEKHYGHLSPAHLATVADALTV